ncbi:MAG: PAS domain-containing protein [Halobacteriaceae archaeon]
MGRRHNRAVTTVLVVSPDEAYTESAVQELSEERHLRVRTAATAADALSALRSETPVDCVLSDSDLSVVDGATLLALVRAQWPDLPFLLLADADGDVGRRAAALGVTERFVGERKRSDWDDVVAVAEAAAAYFRRRDPPRGIERQAARIDAARDAIAVFTGGRLVHLNEAWVDLFDESAAEMLGRRPTAALRADRDALSDPWFAAVADGADPLRQVDVHAKRPNGSLLPVRVTATPLDWSDRAAALVVCRTRSKQREQARFERAVEAAGHAVYVTDAEGTIEYVNPAFEDITGYSAAEAVGRTPAILKSEAHDDDYYEALWETITAGDVWEEEVVDRRQSGEKYYAHQTIAPIVADGAIEGHVAIQTDVTEQHERQERLAHYERAIEGSNDLIAAIDADYNYLFANQRYREYHDLPPRTETARLDEVLDAETWAEAEPRVQRVLDGEEVRYTTERSRPGEPSRVFDVRYYPLPDRESERIAGAVATIRDVTERENRDRQLLVLSRILRHNLHNDMNVILGHAETLASERSGAVQDRAERIVATGEGLLDLTDKQRSVVELISEERTPVSLSAASAIRAPVERLRRSRDDAHIEIDVPDVTLRAIPQLSDAVAELVTNAVDHSDRSTPRVRVSAAVRSDRVLVEVADDGPGIPPQERRILTGDHRIDQLYHGSGMGLWLVHWITSRSDGTLGFEENDPRGSRVTMSLERASDTDAD